MRIQLLLLSAVAIGLTEATPLSKSFSSTSSSSSKNPNLAPVYGSSTDKLSDSYVVVLKSEMISSDKHLSDHHDFVRAMHARQVPDHATSAQYTPSGFHGLGHIYNLIADAASSAVESTFHGYSLHNVTSDLVESIRARPEVAYIEHDSIMRTQDKISPEYAQQLLSTSSTPIYATEKGAPWGLARISHRKQLSLGTYNKYVYDDRSGKDVDVFVIDTGINVDHEEFEGRAKWGKTIPVGAHDFDGNGHGTHCAGSIGSKKYGVSKNANIFAVKVLGDEGSGTNSDVIGGVLWAAQEGQRRFKAGLSIGTVGSMSLGGGYSKALNDVINRAIASGMNMAVAGGNENQDACNVSPASAERAVTVGASSLWDERASFSNWGTCTDIFAPGLNILSTWIGSNTATNTISGTSMAAPHVAGLMAYLLSNYVNDQAPETESFPYVSYLGGFSQVPKAVQSAIKMLFPKFAEGIQNVMAPIPKLPIDPALLKATLLELATKNVLSNIGEGSPNLLAFNNATSV